MYNGFNLVPVAQAKRVIETREPRGLFVAIEGDKYIGIDNRTGDAWTEEFECKEDCLDWLGISAKEKCIKNVTEPVFIAIEFLLDKYFDAINKYPEPRNSAHEAFAFIEEEFDELKAEVWKKPQDRDIEKIKTEAAHVAVTAIRLITDICGEER